MCVAALAGILSLYEVRTIPSLPLLLGSVPETQSSVCMCTCVGLPLCLALALSVNAFKMLVKGGLIDKTIARQSLNTAFKAALLNCRQEGEGCPARET